MSNKPVSEALKNLLSDYYMLYLKTQNYHWNVEGQNFHGLHMQFEEQYKNLADAIGQPPFWSLGFKLQLWRCDLHPFVGGSSN